MLPTTPDNPCSPANGWIFGLAISMMISASALLFFFAGQGLIWLARRAWAWWHGKPRPLSWKEQIAHDYAQLRQESEAHWQASLARMDARAERSRQDHEAWMARRDAREGTVHEPITPPHINHRDDAGEEREAC